MTWEVTELQRDEVGLPRRLDVRDLYEGKSTSAVPHTALSVPTSCFSR